MNSIESLEIGNGFSCSFKTAPILLNGDNWFDDENNVRYSKNVVFRASVGSKLSPGGFLHRCLYECAVLAKGPAKQWWQVRELLVRLKRQNWAFSTPAPCLSFVSAGIEGCISLVAKEIHPRDTPDYACPILQGVVRTDQKLAALAR